MTYPVLIHSDWLFRHSRIDSNKVLCNLQIASVTQHSFRQSDASFCLKSNLLHKFFAQFLAIIKQELFIE